MSGKPENINPIENLFNSRQLYQILFDKAHEAIVFVSDSKIVDCNQASLKLFDFSSKSDLIGKNIWKLSYSEKDNQATKEIETIFASFEPETTHTFNWKFTDSGGKILDTEVTVNSLRYENIVYQQVAIQDNTWLRNKEFELNQSELKYRKIFENVQDVFYRTDLNGILTEISPSIKRYSRYVHSDIIGQPIENFYVNPDTRLLMLKEIHEKGEALDFEVLLKGRDNQEVWSSVNAHFTYDETGKVDGVEGTIRDLTERKQTEEKLKQSFSLLQATLDSTVNGILVVDLNGKIASYNKRFKEIFNHSDEVLDSKRDEAAISSVLSLLKDPELFVSKINYLYNNPEIESNDRIELIDGRILERYSGPQLLDGKPIGRIWSFTDITEKVKAEQQLLLMAHTVKSVNESISITDTKNRILFVNEAFLKTYGYNETSELIGKDISLVRSPLNDPDTTAEILGATAESGWKGEIMNKRKDGSEFPISLSTSIIQNEDGEILGMVGVASDITERKKVEEELQAKEAHLSTLVKTIPDLIWVKDINGVYLTCNLMFEYFFGASAKEIIGKTDYDFVDKELADFFRNHDKKAIKAGRPTSNEEWVVFANDGHRALLETIKTPMYDSKGNTIGVLGIGRDITDRKNAEEKLRQSEVKYRNLIETMPDGYYRSTPEGRFVEVNQAMVDMLGYSSKDELLSIDIKTQLYFKPEDRDNLTLQLDPFDLDVYTLKKKDGTAVWVEDHGWFVRDDNGNIIFHEGVTRDITERKRSEQQLQKYSEELKELNATKDKYFSIIAHDLKSPFNSIIGLSELIKDDAKVLDIATIEQYAGIIHTTSKNTFRLLENLLDWARIQQSQMPFHPVSLVLKTIANEVIELMIEKANSKMIAIINYIPENIIVSADKNMLETILRNLMSNALKFTSQNGKIELKAIERKNEIEISIADNGIGIDDNDVDKIFKVGASYTKRGTQNEKGTGLGLLLCKEFVEKHNGRIWVESQINVGSVFRFTIKSNA